MVIAKISPELKKQKQEAEKLLLETKVGFIKKMQTAVLNKMNGVGRWLDDFEKDFKEPFKFGGSSSVSASSAGIKEAEREDGKTLIKFNNEVNPRKKRKKDNQSTPPRDRPKPRGIYQKGDKFAVLYLGKRLGAKLCIEKDDVIYKEYPKVRERRARETATLKAQTGKAWDCIAPGGRTTYRVTHDDIENLQSTLKFTKYSTIMKCFAKPNAMDCKDTYGGPLETVRGFYEEALPLVEKFEELVREERSRREEALGKTLKEIADLKRRTEAISTESLLV